VYLQNIELFDYSRKYYEVHKRYICTLAGNKAGIRWYVEEHRKRGEIEGAAANAVGIDLES